MKRLDMPAGFAKPGYSFAQSAIPDQSATRAPPKSKMSFDKSEVL
jgi:hypothetical protein